MSVLPAFPHRHLLGIEGLSALDLTGLLDLADEAVELSRQVEKKRSTLRGRTQINLFFEASTRTQSSFEIAGKRLGADVMNMSVASSSIKKGETWCTTAWEGDEMVDGNVLGTPGRDNKCCGSVILSLDELSSALHAEWNAKVLRHQSMSIQGIAAGGTVER